jgi:hypothetical protein
MHYYCQPHRVSIAAGSINEESVRGVLPKIKNHIFVPQDKAGWYDIPEDRIPRHAKFSAGFQKEIDAWKQLGSEPGLG